jgi:hypothetical protein
MIDARAKRWPRRVAKKKLKPRCAAPSYRRRQFLMRN